jgi:hypothetical protein
MPLIKDGSQSGQCLRKRIGKITGKRPLYSGQPQVQNPIPSENKRPKLNGMK